jgi:hypothetical protein
MYKGVVTFVVRSLRTMSTAYHQEQKQPFLKFDQPTISAVAYRDSPAKSCYKVITCFINMNH